MRLVVPGPPRISINCLAVSGSPISFELRPVIDRSKIHAHALHPKSVEERRFLVLRHGIPGGGVDVHISLR